MSKNSTQSKKPVQKSKDSAQAKRLLDAIRKAKHNLTPQQSQMLEERFCPTDCRPSIVMVPPSKGYLKNSGINAWAVNTTAPMLHPQKCELKVTTSRIQVDCTAAGAAAFFLSSLGVPYYGCDGHVIISNGTSYDPTASLVNTMFTNIDMTVNSLFPASYVGDTTNNMQFFQALGLVVIMDPIPVAADLQAGQVIVGQSPHIKTVMVDAGLKPVNIAGTDGFAIVSADTNKQATVLVLDPSPTPYGADGVYANTPASLANTVLNWGAFFVAGLPANTQVTFTVYQLMAAWGHKVSAVVPMGIACAQTACDVSHAIRQTDPDVQSGVVTARPRDRHPTEAAKNKAGALVSSRSAFDTLSEVWAFGKSTAEIVSSLVKDLSIIGL
jgi:hypothetical protein